jgi:predicted phosphodiesterase
MRFLLVSDIHGNVTAVRKLRAMETNRFDAVVVAGDIGSKGAAETMGVLASFECPVLYVYGNWDRDLAYDANFGADCHHLHLAPFGWKASVSRGLPSGGKSTKAVHSNADS